MRPRTIPYAFLFLLCLLVTGGMTCGDPQYADDELWERVLKQQPDLQKLNNSRELSAEKLRKARAERSPEIGFDFSGSYIGNPADPIVIYPGDISGDLSLPADTGPVKVYEGQESAHYQFSLSLTQPVFTWGKINTAIKLQRELMAVVDVEYEARKEELRSTLLVLLDSLWYTRRIEETLEKQLSAVERLLETSQDNYEQGLILSDEVHSRQMQVLETQLARSQATADRGQLLFELQRMTGLFDLSVTEISHSPGSTLYLEADPEALKAREDEVLSKDNSTLKLLGHAKTARDLAVDIAKASVYWKPDFALKIDLGYSGPRFPLLETDWYRQNDHAFNVTVAFSTTMWDGGGKLADIAVRNLETRQAELDITAARGQLRYSFRDAVGTFEVLQSRADYLQQTVQVNREIVSRKERQYESGSAGQWELIAARSDLYQNEIDYYQTMAELSQSYHTVISMLK